MIEVSTLNIINNKMPDALFENISIMMDDEILKKIKNKLEDRMRALEELVDLLHFFMVAVDDLGFTATDLYKAYIQKNDHNWKRFKEKIGWGKNDKEHQDSPLGSEKHG